MAVLGLDTSNYTTSSALYDRGIITQSRRLLSVDHGKRGLRQSDAVFLHTRQLSSVLSDLGTQRDLQAVGVSKAPRDAHDSYMPCFLVGRMVAESISSLMGIPCRYFSHQAGHLAAALWSAGRMDMIEKEFLAFHVSGGTFEALHISPVMEGVFQVKPLADTSDLTAGQVIDRVGVMLGLSFPCGAEMERLAAISSKTFNTRPPVKEGTVSFSGLENLCAKMYNDKEPPEDIAKYCFEYIAHSLLLVTKHLRGLYGDLDILYAGGVMSNSYIKAVLSHEKSLFATPDLSSDNAAGIAVLTAYKEDLL